MIGTAKAASAGNEPPRGKPRGIFKGKIHFITASCGELNPIDFASPFKGFV
jgi:hypothetical protein